LINKIGSPINFTRSTAFLPSTVLQPNGDPHGERRQWSKGTHTKLGPIGAGRGCSSTIHCRRLKSRTLVAVKRFRRCADRDPLSSIDSVEEGMTAFPIWRDRPPLQPIAWLSALAVATLALVLMATTADARGGRSHGRRIGAAVLKEPSSTPAVTTSAPLQAPQPTDPPAKPSVSLSNVGVIPTPPPPPATPPASQIGVPQTQLLPIAPLSISTSNSTAVPTALPTGGSSGVALPETPGGGREGLAACMEFWDSGTHMTKAEWKAACERSVHRLETISDTKKP